MKTKIILLLCSTILVFSAQSQELNYSQFYHNKTMINPAYTGLTKQLSLTGLHRNQWMGIGDHNLFKSNAIIADYGLSEKSSGNYGSGLGLGLVYDQSTVGSSNYRTNQIRFNISSDAAKIGKERYGFMAQLPVGISIGYIKQQYDISSLIFSDQLDPVLGFVNPGTVNPELMSQNLNQMLDIGAGGMFGIKLRKKNHQTTYISLGYSYNKYIQLNNDSEYSYPDKWSFHGFYHQPIETYMLSSGIIYQSRGDLKNFIIGTELSTEYNLGFGVWMRNQRHILDMSNYSDIIFDISYRHNQFVFGYSYDMSISSLSNKSSKGTHEISLKINFYDDKTRVKNQRRKNNTCFFQGLG